MRSTFLIRLACCAAAVLLGKELSAKTLELGFQTGEVLAAEITGAAQEIINLEGSPYKCSFDKKIYVQVVIKMFPGRSISPLDYTLNINGNTANCLAAVCDDEVFVCNPSERYPEKDSLVRLLFVFDGNRVTTGSGSQKTRAVLKSALRNRRAVSFELKNLGSRKFTPVKDIPAGGTF
ncbi:MAG: hypothetical protein E7056_02700 [Lentisphaerae bacterium]|nr:hypothetical protein [Lentisphaerota bacterium]